MMFKKELDRKNRDRDRDRKKNSGNGKLILLKQDENITMIIVLFNLFDIDTMAGYLILITNCWFFFSHWHSERQNVVIFKTPKTFTY